MGLRHLLMPRVYLTRRHVSEVKEHTVFAQAAPANLVALARACAGGTPETHPNTLHHSVTSRLGTRP
jgi:hypothetical protein